METRLAPRLNIDLKIISKLDDEYQQKFSLASGNKFEVRTLDISELGVGILSKYFIPKGVVLDLDIEGKPLGLDRDISTKGEVRYCKFVRNLGYKCGIKFLNISQPDRKAIAYFISTYERRRASRVKLAD